jgi:hypothetical protein
MSVAFALWDVRRKMRPLRGELPFLAPLRFGTEMQEEGEG